MDPIAHTFAGATLATAGLRRKTPLATAALLIGANAPDVDVISMFGAPYAQLAFRRGITHGVLALALWPFLIAATLLAWDRFVRRRRNAAAAPARAGPVLGLAALAVLTHPALDWLNNYGMRWLMPFDGRWFYGDAVFIVDPWIWLSLGSVPFLAYSRCLGPLLSWTGFWVAASLLVLLIPGIPLAGRALWIVWLVALVSVRAFAPAVDARLVPYEWGAKVLLGIAVVYVGVLATVDFAERAALEAELAARGIGPIERVMVGPVPANPFAGEFVAATPTEYYLGDWDWLGQPRIALADEPIRRNETDRFYEAAAASVEAGRFLAWARFPYAVIERGDDGYAVGFVDARYGAAGRLLGPVVQLDENLRPLSSR